MLIEWSSDWQCSCFYHAWRTATAPNTPGGDLQEGNSGAPPSAVQHAIRSLLPELDAALAMATENKSRAWRLLPILASRFPGNKPLAEALITRVAGRAALLPARLDRLTHAIQAVEAACLQAAPDLQQQLPNRIGPIRQAWEAFGPGLLKQMAARTDPALFVESAQAHVVEPVAGGGEPYLELNAIIFEGVLAHPHPQVPETLRLAWMLSQLNNDLPMYSELIPGPRFLEVSKLAMIPPAVAAGADLDLCRDDLPTWRQAIAIWAPTIFGSDQQVDSLRAWWETYRESSTDWRTALTALDQLLIAAEEGSTP